MSKYIITWAGAGAPHPVWRSMQHYAEHIGARLLVIPSWYDDLHQDFTEDAIFKPMKLHPNLTVYPEVAIKSTIVRPLTGLEVYAGTSWGVFGHPRKQLRTIATGSRCARQVQTTGAATSNNNYPTTAIGQRAKQHHVYGATLVETSKSGTLHVRSLPADTRGKLYDLGKCIHPDGTIEQVRTRALICGDLHASRLDDRVAAATFWGRGCMVGELNPENIVLHDVYDMQADNHHRARELRTQYASSFYSALTVEDELSITADILQKICDVTPGNVRVIQSNHDDALDKWLESPGNVSPRNRRVYHELWVLLMRHYEKHGVWPSALPSYVLDRFGDCDGKLSFVPRNQSFAVEGVELGYHGDKGLNGARGTSNSYTRLGVKSVIGHSHTPAILDGTYVVGVSGSLDMGYNYLPSSWMHAHCVLYQGGKRQLINIIDGEWRA